MGKAGTNSFIHMDIVKGCSGMVKIYPVLIDVSSSSSENIYLI